MVYDIKSERNRVRHVVPDVSPGHLAQEADAQSEAHEKPSGGSQPYPVV